MRNNRDAKCEKVVVTIPFPDRTLSTALSANYGSVAHNAVTKETVWELGNAHHEREPVLEGTVSLPADYKVGPFGSAAAEHG